jgi:alternate signal-mediated exported protein
VTTPCPSPNELLIIPAAAGGPGLARRGAGDECELTPSATFTVNGANRNHITDADDTGTAEIVATITVTFNGPAVTNTNQNLTATLNTVAVTATQNHDPA